ncbi:hypothetical protein Plav_0334 [Parvibaculum lavamentivorans DS-1]|uniref:Uncharacterized protein n=1 Tax=Parvibaculum lavamentivorans (strain DS-1 / DSM 13023 / NCIMB 13966) TaxID=402881 RepID=A7HPX4_PARL1|nr:hypothetical protein Plav_0334 [Parvibaculum lavamentivorans DS-1]
MGGYAVNKGNRNPYQPEDPQGADDCDLSFTVDLVGVQPEITSSLSFGDELLVTLKTNGAVTSVVCADERGEVAGTLAAFRGLARLIGCLRQGESYVAVVQAASPTRCMVFVRRR